MSDDKRVPEEGISTLETLDALLKDLYGRVRVVRKVRALVEQGHEVPDVTPIVALPKIGDERKRPWSLRPGSDVERVVNMLEAAGERGLSEPEIVENLRQSGRLQRVKDPIRSVHWILYQLERRTNAVKRDPSGRWRVVGSIPRKA